MPRLSNLQLERIRNMMYGSPAPRLGAAKAHQTIHDLLWHIEAMYQECACELAKARGCEPTNLCWNDCADAALKHLKEERD